MRSITRTGLIALTVAVPLAAAVYATKSPVQGQGGMMDENQMDDMMGQDGMGGMGGMMNMMQQMSQMMESCNQMMQGMMNDEGGKAPNEQWRDRNSEPKSPQQ